jgi:hypothetical protein
MVDLPAPPARSLFPPPSFPVYGLLEALVGNALAAAEAHADWATVIWRVDGVAVQASAWSFAGGWARFTDAAEGVYLSVVGLGPDARPEGLALAALRDSGAFHFDVPGPLSLELAARSRQTAGVPYEEHPPWRSTVWHPDQLQFIG